MRFNIVSNLGNGHGLQREYQLLKQELESRGHQVHGIQFNLYQRSVQPADVNIFIETVVPQLFPSAPQQWVIPHPEWWSPAYQATLPQVTKVLCKTKDCLRLFVPLVGERAIYLGFLSQDLYRSAVPKEDKFLHVVGKSMVKGTEAILQAWQQLTYPLTIVTSLTSVNAEARRIPQITVRSNVMDAELALLYNSCRFHLCPSQYEGFGHTLHEALGVGALVITVDAPPMSEADTPQELLVPVNNVGARCLAKMYMVAPRSIVEKAHVAMGMSPERKEQLSLRARQLFELGRQEFRENLGRLC